MKTTIIMLCFIGAVFANPISFSAHSVSESSELDSNSTESLPVSQSSENDTSEIQSSEETTSSQIQSSESVSESSESSESVETTSEDTTSEESNSQSDEDGENDSMGETRDDSMGSEENMRKSWVRVVASVIKDLSAEDNSSTEINGGQSSEKQPALSSTDATAQGQPIHPLVDNPSDTTSEESDSSESNETSEASDSSDASKSTEDSNASDSTELGQLKTQDCVNGTQSCESEEYFFQAIGDDAHFAVDNLMVPEEDERELSLRR